eukprot:scaffold36111_cov101-Isochrysis_galbana.AAC.1
MRQGLDAVHTMGRSQHTMRCISTTSDIQPITRAHPHPHPAPILSSRSVFADKARRFGAAGGPTGAGRFGAAGGRGGARGAGVGGAEAGAGADARHGELPQRRHQQGCATLRG